MFEKKIDCAIVENQVVICGKIRSSKYFRSLRGWRTKGEGGGNERASSSNLTSTLPLLCTPATQAKYFR